MAGRSPFDRSGLSAYLELTKPRIVFLLLLVALSAYVASSPSTVSLPTLILLLVAGALSSAGSSAVNQYLDRDIDGVMSRTKHRPLPTGRLQPRQALTFGLLLIGSGALLALAINPLTALFILLGAFVYLVIYTLILKRRSTWNIVIGGFAGSCPALAGSAAAVNAITQPAIFLAILVFLWTPGHFWASSLRNREDYRKAGIPMLPAVVKERVAVRAIVISTAILPVYAYLSFVLDALSLVTLLPTLAASLVLVYLTLGILRDTRAAWSSFKFSGVYLATALVAVAVGPYLA